MTLGKCYTFALEGVIAHIVEVQANIGPGLPGISVVGQPDTAITESRTRVRTAVANSTLAWPKTKIVVSMSPASLPKSGSHFDVPMAVAILVAGRKGSNGLENASEIHRRLASTLFLGELGLDGTLRSVAGALPALIAARQAGFDSIVLPPGNSAEAKLAPDLTVYVAETLNDVFSWVCLQRVLPLAGAYAEGAYGSAVAGKRTDSQALDFSDIAGQHDAKKAAEIAAAGGHHLMMIGPPGSGKSMVAARIPGILPRLDNKQAVAATAIHSLAGTVGKVVEIPPFIAPHASITRAALMGGGSGNPRPGAVSLAHHGVLFLDEVSETPAAVLDSLRAPLEEGEVRIARARREITYPARFQLIMAANPCRCAAEDPVSCRCSATERQGYLRNISGPLRDRLDMVVRLSGQAAIICAEQEETSSAIADRVEQARQRAARRWNKVGLAARTNAEISPSYLRRHFPAEESAMAMLVAYLSTGQLSQRGVDRCLKLAWTLSDLAGTSLPQIDHVGTALEMRGAHQAAVAL